MKRFTRLFKRPQLIIAPPVPPLIFRRDWDTYANSLHRVIEADIKYDLGELTDEDIKAMNTRQLTTPSEPTMNDMNRTRVWYTSTTVRVEVV